MIVQIQILYLMEDFYKRSMQQQPSQQRPQGGSPRLKPSQDLGSRPNKVALSDVNPSTAKGGKGTPTGSAKPEPKLGKSSVADVGVSPKKPPEGQNSRKRLAAQMGDDDLPNAINGFLNSTKEDSFQKLYSKELDLDEDEVPVILHELNDSAIHFISHEQFERSLSLLQKAQTLLDRLQFQKNPKDRFLIQVTMHNMALCFQKMGALEECALCLDACLHQINSQYLLPKFSGKPTRKLKKIKYECKIHMQVCALLSQLHRHQEALCHAKRAVQISQYLLLDLLALCEENFKKSIKAKQREQKVHEEQENIKATDAGLSISQASSKADLIYYDDNISMLERTAFRVYPIIKEIVSKMVKHKDVESVDKPGSKPKAEPESESVKLTLKQQHVNMKVLLGYLNQSEWLYLLNIGNIMQITPLTIHDLYSNSKIDVELSRDSILEKISFLAISYFCVSTELRFLVSSKEKLSIDPVQVKAESEFWHGKALEISCGFLPSESPLVTHILSSYQKHHAPVQQSIPEDQQAEIDLRVIRPERGIDKSQFQPMIRVNKQLNIALSPLSLSPCNHQAHEKQKKGQPMSISSKNNESVATSSNATPSNLNNDQKRLRNPANQLVGQTSIEDLAINNIALAHSIQALVLEPSPKSQNEDILFDNNLDGHTKHRQYQANSKEDQEGRLRGYLDDVMEIKDDIPTNQFEKVVDIRTLNLEKENQQDTSFDSSNLMLQSLKKLDQQRSEDLTEMDEAEFITDSRPQRKYDKDIEDGPKAQHTKVFLKHEKPQAKASPGSKEKQAVNQSMMAVPPSQAERKGLPNDNDSDESARKGNQSFLLPCDHMVLGQSGKLGEPSERARKKASPNSKRAEADGPEPADAAKLQSGTQSADQKKQISIEQLKEFLKQGKIQIPQSQIQNQKKDQRPNTTLPEDSREQIADTKAKRSQTPKGRQESPRSTKSEQNTSLILKSDTSFVIGQEQRKSVQKRESSQEKQDKSRSRSKGKSNQTKKIESGGRNNNQGRPLSRGVNTVPNSNKLTSRGQLNNSNNQIESTNKPRPPSSQHNRKLQQQRPDSRRMSGNKRRKVLQDDEIDDMRRSGSETAARTSADCNVTKDGISSVERSFQTKSGQGTRATNFQTFQGRQGVHCATQNSPQHQAQQKPRSTGHIGIGQLNSASANLIKVQNPVGFQNVVIGDKTANGVKGRNVIDQSLLSGSSLNQSSQVESRSLKILDKSLNVDSQVILDTSKDTSQFIGVQDARSRVNVTRPKSKKKASKQQQLQNEIMNFLTTNQKHSDQEDLALQKQLMIKKALESQFRDGFDVRRKSANTISNNSMVTGMPHSLSSAANGFSSVSTATTGHLQPITNGLGTPMIATTGHHATSMQTPNTHQVQLQQTASNFNSQPQASNSAKRKVLQVNGSGPLPFNADPRTQQTANAINTQSQKTINLSRLGIQMPAQANGIDPPTGIEFAHSTQNQHTKQLHPINQQNAQVLYSQLIQFQAGQTKQQAAKVQNINGHSSQKKFFKERVSPQTQTVPQGGQPSKKQIKQKSVSPHNNHVNTQIVDNFIQNSNLFLSSNSGVPASQVMQKRNLASQQQQRLNHAAQQQYSTNVVTTQSRKGPQERFLGEKQNPQREPTPVYTQESLGKDRSSSKENTYAMVKQPVNGAHASLSQATLANQRQTLSTMYQQMKEQKDREKKVTKSSFKDDGDLALV